MRGLLGLDRLPPGQAMLFERARSVHTLGMRFPVTVAFLDASYRVVRVRRMPPGRLALPRLGVRHVLELPADALVRVGDVFEARDGREGQWIRAYRSARAR